jgi:micrococcal nuclease
MTRRTCVVDGDTFWLEGEKIRIADIDTPEISEPKCDAEYQLGMKATHTASRPTERRRVRGSADRKS